MCTGGLLKYFFLNIIIKTGSNKKKKKKADDNIVLDSIFKMIFNFPIVVFIIVRAPCTRNQFYCCRRWLVAVFFSNNYFKPRAQWNNFSCPTPRRGIRRRRENSLAADFNACSYYERKTEPTWSGCNITKKICLRRRGIVTAAVNNSRKTYYFFCCK